MKRLVLKTVEYVIFFALLIVFFIVASPMLPTKKFAATYVVATGSMEPVIKTGALAVAVTTDINNLKTGDVITFTSPVNPEHTIIHRIVEKEANQTEMVSFITKGDNNDTVDDWRVTDDLILGKAIFTIPYLGSLIDYLKTPLGYGIGVGIPTLIFVVFQVLRIRQGIHEEVEKRTKEAIQKTKSKTNPSSLLSIFLITLGLLLSTSTKALALFSDSVELTGLTLSVTQIQELPTLDFYKYQDEIAVGFRLEKINDYPQGTFTIRYKRDGGIEEEIMGTIDNSTLDNIYISPKFILGTCSGDDCTYHQNIEDLVLTVVLIDSSGNTVTLTKELEINTAPEVIELPEQCRLLTGKIFIRIEGTSGDDKIEGSSKSELILGLEGNDYIDGGGGDDCIVGGDGDDTIDGGGGNDVILGGSGNDRIEAGSGNDTVYAGTGSDRVEAGSGDDTVYGDEGQDYLDGGAGEDKMYGGGGNDTLKGGSGDDFIYGEDGDDALTGDSGNDYLDGGTGTNWIDGNSGTDTCVDATHSDSCEL